MKDEGGVRKDCPKTKTASLIACYYFCLFVQAVVISNNEIYDPSVVLIVRQLVKCVYL